MTQYEGVCVGGPYDKKMIAHLSKVLSVTIYTGAALKAVGNQIPQHDRIGKTEFYYFEDFCFTDGRVGFWRHESIPSRKSLIEHLAAGYMAR